MSRDKRKAESRQNSLLLRAFRDDGITIHHVGGIARATPELQALVRLGLVVIPLNRGTPPKWSKLFDGFFPLGGLGIHGHAPRLRAHLTESGRRRAETLAAAATRRFSIQDLAYGKRGELLFSRDRDG